MKKTIRLLSCLFLLFALFANALPCGPGYVSPVFDVRRAPEFPYTDFAAGNLGIIKPTFERSVLFAAYRYINGGAFSADEQKALIDIWKARFRNEGTDDRSVDEAVKAWVEKRKDVADKEEKLPEIYVEREYGGYDFFPNCAANAFETATETLSSRIGSYGAEDVNVKHWLTAQDIVFANCASGKQSPEPLVPGMPEWLQKDRAYQIAAAAFYSLDFEKAKSIFREIALDYDSPWRETADYLVGRTLIRQASMTEDPDRVKRYYEEAEEHFRSFSPSTNKFTDSVEGMLGMIKYRLRPEERVQELANILRSSGSRNFRQELIDLTWLLSGFEQKILSDRERDRLQEIVATIKPASNGEEPKLTPEQQNALRRLKEVNERTPGPQYIETMNVTASSEKKSDTDLVFIIHSEDFSRSWRIYVSTDANDADALAETERVVGEPLSERMKDEVRRGRQNAYTGQFSQRRSSGRRNYLYSDESLRIAMLPDFLKNNDLTDWLFAYQIQGDEAYRYSLERYRQTSSPLWLMTALSKANRSSAELELLLKDAERADRHSPSYPTIGYHAARLLIEQGKSAEAKKLIEDIFAYSADIPVSSANQLDNLRQGLAETLDDFLRFSLRRPFTFDFSGSFGSVDEIIEEMKRNYNPEYNKEGREAYEREVEEQFRNEKEWRDRVMFDGRTVNTINQFFSLSLLIEASNSDRLPPYLRERFVVAAWTRAVLLDDTATATRLAPEVVKYHPDLAESLRFIQIANGPAARRNATLYMLVKNPKLTPFIEGGLGKANNDPDPWDTDNWWCEPYDEVYDEETENTVNRSSIKPPAFITPAHKAAVDREREKLKGFGDATTYLGNRVLEWARRSPNDARIPESLYVMHTANGWSKWSCGGNFELQKEIGELLKRRYPNSPWTRKLISEEAEQ
ncbi:MAG: hypothetical protein KF855_04455 [Acidobacteria bacterium]|nr:hypothetical protein [Acidobacteriota bacterium]